MKYLPIYSLNLIIVIHSLSVMSGYGQNVALSVQTGHSASITLIAFNTDGNILASADQDNNLKLWQVASGREIATWRENASVKVLLFSPDNEYLFTGNENGMLNIWDIAQSEVVESFSFGKEILSLCFSPDPNIVYVASDQLYKLELNTKKRSVLLNTRIIDIHRTPDNHFYLCDSTGATNVMDIDERIVENKWTFIRKSKFKMIAKKNTLDFVAYSDMAGIVTYVRNSKIQAYDLKNGRKLYSIIGDYIDMPFHGIASSNKNNLLIAGCEDSKVYVLDLHTGKIIKRQYKHLARVNDIAFSPDESIFASASNDRSIIIWDTKTLKPVRRLYSRAFSIESIDVNSDGSILALGDELGYLKILDMKSVKLELTSTKNHLRKISQLQLFPSDTLIATGGFDNKIVIRSLNQKDFLKKLTYKKNFRIKALGNKLLGMLKIYVEPYSMVECIAVSPDNKYLVVGGKTKFSTKKKNYFKKSQKIPLIVYDAINFKRKYKLTKAYNNQIKSVAFGPDSKTLLSASDKTIMEWKFANKKVISREIPVYSVNKIEFLSSDTIMILSNRQFLLYDLKNERENIIYKSGKKMDGFTYDKNSKLLALAIQNEIKLFRLTDPDNVLFTLKGHRSEITDMVFLPKSSRLVSSSKDATVKIWDVTKGKLIVTIIPIDREELIFLTDDNYYIASKNALDGIGFKYGKQFFPPDQFDLKYNRPDIVLSRMGIGSKELIDTYYHAYKKRLKKMNFTEKMLGEDFHVPEISILNRQQYDMKTMDKMLSMTLSTHDTKYKLDRINVWLNDVPVYGSEGIDLREKDTDSVETKFNLDLAAGKNKIQVSALNKKGAESLKETIEIEYEGPVQKPELYIVSIGTSIYQDDRFNLRYAAKDAEDMVNLFANKKIFGNVYHKILTNEQVTKDNIMELKQFLLKAGRDDVVILFIAGHGILDANYDYYYATHDIDFNNPSAKGIVYEDIEALLDGLKALKKLFFMDTCHSGEVDKDEVEVAQHKETEQGEVVFRSVGVGIKQKEGLGNTTELMKELFTDLRRGTGATVISSAGGVEYAMEGDKWNNGLFTYCVLSGLKDKDADLNKDGEVMLSELQSYVRDQVSELSNGMQVPTSRIENISMDFRVW